MEVSAENGAGGFILPDDHVDIILTRRDKAAEKLIGVEKITSEAILRNVRVLAIDQAVEEKGRPEGRGRQDRDARIEPRPKPRLSRCRVSSARCRWHCAVWSTRNHRPSKAATTTISAAP